MSSLFSLSRRTFSSADSFRRLRISSKSLQSSENSSSPSTSSTKSRFPSLIFCVAFFSFTSGVAILLYIHRPIDKAVNTRITVAVNRRSFAISLTCVWLFADSPTEMSYTTSDEFFACCASFVWLNPYNDAENKSSGTRILIPNPIIILVFNFIRIILYPVCYVQLWQLSNGCH